MKSQILMAIPSIDFAREKALSFNLYVHLPSAQKTILYRRKGAEVEADRFSMIQNESSITFLIEKEAYADYLKHVSNRLASLIGKTPEPETTKELTRITRTLLMNPINTATSAQAQQMLKSLNDISSLIIVDLVSDAQPPQKKLYSNFLKLSRGGTSFQKHPINVMTLSLLIATGIGYTDSESLKDLMFAGLVHDLGLVRLPIKVIQNSHNPFVLGLADRQLLQQHPTLTLEILKSKEIYLSRRAQSIILQHHEENNGNGYPLGIDGGAIEPLAQVLLIADQIDALLNEPNSGRSIFDSVKLLVAKFRKDKVLISVIQDRLEKLLAFDEST